jgi:hypothetical protein
MPVVTSEHLEILALQGEQYVRNTFDMQRHKGRLLWTYHNSLQTRSVAKYTEQLCQLLDMDDLWCKNLLRMLAYRHDSHMVYTLVPHATGLILHREFLQSEIAAADALQQDLQALIPFTQKQSSFEHACRQSILGTTVTFDSTTGFKHHKTIDETQLCDLLRIADLGVVFLDTDDAYILSSHALFLEKYPEVLHSGECVLYFRQFAQSQQQFLEFCATILQEAEESLRHYAFREIDFLKSMTTLQMSVEQKKIAAQHQNKYALHADAADIVALLQKTYEKIEFALSHLKI